MKRCLLVLPLVIGCSSSDPASTTQPGDAPAPVEVAAPQAELGLAVIDNRGSERLVMGAFSTAPRSGESCERQQIAGCTVSTCTKTDDASLGTPVDPGTLTASSPSVGNDVTIPLADGYARLVQPGNFPAAGEEVRLVGTGGSAVAAFDLKVKMPTSLTFKTFAGCAPSNKSCELGRAHADAAWAGGVGDYVSVSLAPTLDLPTRVSLRCTFAAAPGKGRVPADALAKLPRGAYNVNMIAAGGPVESTAGTGLKVYATAQRYVGSGSVTLRD